MCDEQLMGIGGEIALSGNKKLKKKTEKMEKRKKSKQWEKTKKEKNGKRKNGREPLTPVRKRNVLEQLANGMCPSSISRVTSWHRVHSSSQQSKLAFHVANVTSLQVEQGRSSPILVADQTLIPVRDQICGQDVHALDLKTFPPQGLMDAHLTVSILSSQFLSL